MVTSAAHEQVRLAAAVVTYRASPVVQTLERFRQTSTSARFASKCRAQRCTALVLLSCPE